MNITLTNVFIFVSGKQNVLCGDPRDMLSAERIARCSRGNRSQGILHVHYDPIASTKFGNVHRWPYFCLSYRYIVGRVPRGILTLWCASRLRENLK